MDIIFKCLSECIRDLARNILWMAVLAVLFALLWLFLVMGGWDLIWFRDILIAALAGLILISLICCLCACGKRLEG